MLIDSKDGRGLPGHRHFASMESWGVKRVAVEKEKMASTDELPLSQKMQDRSPSQLSVMTRE